MGDFVDVEGKLGLHVGVGRLCVVDDRAELRLEFGERNGNGQVCWLGSDRRSRRCSRRAPTAKASSSALEALRKRATTKTL